MTTLVSKTVNITVGATGAVSAIEAVCFDANQDGLINEVEGSMFAEALGSGIGNPAYNPRFDADKDGAIDSYDDMVFRLAMPEMSLSSIRGKVRTNIVKVLAWPETREVPQWSANLVKLNKAEVQKFTGYGKGYPGSIRGWVNVQCHHYVAGYICQEFASDTSIAAYKDLGYGCLFDACSQSHAYIIFWTGNDWRELNNWCILEPQTGKILGRAGNAGLPGMYHTLLINFLSRVYVWPYTGELKIESRVLVADFSAGMVDIWPDPGRISPDTKEPWPDIIDVNRGL